MSKYKVHVLISRSLDRDNRDKNSGIGSETSSELVEILKICKLWAEYSGGNFPVFLANSLASFFESYNEEQYQKATLEIFRLLAKTNLSVCSQVGGISLLLDACLDSAFSDKIESILYTLLLILNDSSSLKLLGGQFEIGRFFFIFTDLYYQEFLSDSSMQKKSQYKYYGRLENILAQAKKSILILLKSWVGLIYIGNEKKSLSSLINALKQPINSQVRNVIFEIIQEILSLGSFKSISTLQVSVQSLINCYLALLVQVLVDCGLYTTLLELSGVDDSKIAETAQKLLKKLTTLMHNLLPGVIHESEILVHSLGEYSMQMQTWAAEIINTLGHNNVQEMKETDPNQSKFLMMCESAFAAMTLGVPSQIIKSEKPKSLSATEFDEIAFNKILKETGILEKNWNKWDWQKIQEFIDKYFISQDEIKFLLLNYEKVVIKLISYFQPSANAFVALPWIPENFTQAKIGYLLLKSLLKRKEGRKLLSQSSKGFYSVTTSYCRELGKLIELYVLRSKPVEEKGKPRTITENPDNSLLIAIKLLEAEKFATTMMREYISWIGLFTKTSYGLDILEDFKVLENLLKLADRRAESAGPHDHILSLLIFTLDYSEVEFINNFNINPQITPRIFLQMCLENGSDKIVRDCLEQLRLLYRSEMKDFASWGIELLVTKTYFNSAISSMALDVLDEVTQDPKNLKQLLQKNPQLTNFVNEGKKNFLLKFLGSNEGFDYLNTNGWVEHELNNWLERDNYDYVDSIEKLLVESLQIIKEEKTDSSIPKFQISSNSEGQSFPSFTVVRLPWTVGVEIKGDSESQNFVFTSINLDFLSNSEGFVLEARQIKKPETKEFLFSSNEEFIINMFLRIGCKCIDFQGKLKEGPCYQRCDKSDLEHFVYKKDKNSFSVYKKGVVFVFEYIPNSDKFKLGSVQVHFQFGFEKSKNSISKIPIHIFGEIYKSINGRKLFDEGNYLEKIVAKLESSNVRDIRAAIWAVSHFGSSPNGARVFIEKEIFEKIIRISEDHPIISLRGTCLYGINLLAATISGRHKLEKMGWISHNKSGIGFLCLPRNFRKYFMISDPFVGSEIDQYLFSDIMYLEDNFPLNEEQRQIVKFFDMMLNSQMRKEAFRELEKKKAAKPEIFDDKNIFRHIVIRLKSFNFTSFERKAFSKFFEKILKEINVCTILEKLPI